MRWGFQFIPAVLLAAQLSGAASSTNVDVWSDFPWPQPDMRPELAACAAQVAAREHSQALAGMDALIAADPADAGALHLSALLFWQGGDREEATRRLILATRAKDARPVSLWALAALSAQSRSWAESVGWIKRAIRQSPAGAAMSWLDRPYFPALCDYPAYRELLEGLGLRGLCPSDIPITFEPRREARAPRAVELDALLEKSGPVGSLQLRVNETNPAVKLQLAVPGAEEGPVR